MKSGQSLIRIFLIFFISTFLIGCPEDSETTNGPEPVPTVTSTETASTSESESCSLAAMLVLDMSLSMTNSASSSGSTTIWDRVNSAITQTVNLIPPNRWELGFVTFPESGSPAGELRLISDTPVNTRTQFKNEINALEPYGYTSYIVTPGFQAATLLVGSELPQFMVIMSDGNICADCSNEQNMSNYIKGLGIFIVTVGYNLSGTSLDIMKEMASTKGDGTKAFINTSSGDQLYENLKNELDGLCRYLEASITVNPSSSRLAAGGSQSHQLTAKWNFGPERDYNIWANPYGGGYSGTITIEETTITLGPNRPEHTQKIVLTVPDTTFPGNYSQTIRMIAGPGTRALSTALPIEVTGFHAQIEFSGNNVPPFLEMDWYQNTSLYLGKVWVGINTAVPTNISLNAFVRKRGETVGVSGNDWEIFVFPSASLTVEPNTSLFLENGFHSFIQIRTPQGLNPGDEYELEVVVIGDSKRFSNTHLFVIPNG